MKSNEEMKTNNTQIQEKLDIAIEYADTEVVKLQDNIGGHTSLSDLESNHKNVEFRILAKKDNLDHENESIKNKVNQQKYQSNTDITEMYELYANTINDCSQFINQSCQQVGKIDNICDIMKQKKVPKYDEAKLKRKLEKRDKAYKELENAKADYMKL